MYEVEEKEETHNVIWTVEHLFHEGEKVVESSRDREIFISTRTFCQIPLPDLNITIWI